MNVLSLYIFVVIFLFHGFLHRKGLGYFNSVGGDRQGGGKKARLTPLTLIVCNNSNIYDILLLMLAAGD